MEENNIEERLEKLEKSNKKSIGVIIALVIIVLILCALLLLTKTNILSTLGITNKQGNSGGEVVDKNEEKETEKETKVEKIEGPEVTETAKNLVDNLSHVSGCRLLDEFLSTTKLTAKELPGYVPFQIVMSLDIYPKYQNQPRPDSISLGEVSNYAKKYFGKNYTFVPTDPKECSEYKYDVAKSAYIKGQAGCGGACGPQEYTVNSAYIEGEYLYASVTNKGTTYLFTFMNEDNNYIFVSTEPVA